MLPACLSQAVYISTLVIVSVFRRAGTGIKKIKNASIKRYICCVGRGSSYKHVSCAEREQAEVRDQGIIFTLIKLRQYFFASVL